MKRLSLFLAVISLCLGPGLRAQDAATEERLKKLDGLVQDLLEDKANQKKQIEALSKEVRELREQVSKPTGDYASHDDLRALAKKVQEVDDKRIADSERIANQIEKLAKMPAGSSPGKKKSASPPSEKSGDAAAEKGFEHTIASGDTLSTIAQAYREKNIKVSVDDIRKANPGLKDDKLMVGQKIWIPAPQK